MTQLRDIDYNGYMPTTAKPGRHRRYPGWANVPNWLRWTLAINAAVIATASFLALMH